MANQRHRKHRRHHPAKKRKGIVQQPATSAAQRPLIPTHIITNINRFTVTAAFLLACYPVVDFQKVVISAGRLYYVFFFVLILLLIVKMGIQQSTIALFTGIRRNPLLKENFRRYVVWGFALNIFIIIVSAMPLLYANGFITRFGNWLHTRLPGRPLIGDKSAIAIFYLLGAAVSGVIGNLTYDVLKLAVRKLRKKDFTPLLKDGP